MTTVAILQARMRSTRLPGKVLLPIGGQPMLALIVKRLRPARRISQLVVATGDDAANDPIASLAGSLGVSCFRGSEDDCLDRYYQAARRFGATIVVRLTADNPLVDAAFVDWTIEQFVNSPHTCDYLSTHGKTFPLGLSVEICSFDALAAAWEQDTDPCTREHVMPYLYRERGRFRVYELVSDGNFGHVRATVDTPEDLMFIRRIYDYFGHDRFNWREAMAALDVHPEWLDINRHVQQFALPVQPGSAIAGTGDTK